MSWNTGWILVALAIIQVVNGYVEIDYPENVIEAKSAGSRIVSGWDARPGQHPHQIGLRMVNVQGGVSSCGGSIIHESFALTAAHCTAGQFTLVVIAGVTNLTNPQYISETTTWFNHPTFNSDMPSVVQPNDISVIQLTHPVTFSSLLQPIRIQPSAVAFADYDGETLYASGFGRTWTGGSTSEVLQWVYLTAVSNDFCFRTFGSIITDNSICARFYNVTSQSICQGDSGGPLVHVGDDGIPTLVGISSFVAGGDFGCHSGIPGGFIRPGPFLPWLEEVTNIDFEEEDTTEVPETTTTTTTTTTTPEPETTTTTTTEAPTTEEPEEEDKDSESSSEEEDPELADLLKRLEVKVKVKVKMDKFKRKHVIHEKHHH